MQHATRDVAAVVDIVAMLQLICTAATVASLAAWQKLTSYFACHSQRCRQFQHQLQLQLHCPAAATATTATATFPLPTRFAF